MLLHEYQIGYFSDEKWEGRHINALRVHVYISLKAFPGWDKYLNNTISLTHYSSKQLVYH